MKQKDGFLLYCTQWDLISMLSMEQRGECITAIYEYALTCKLPEIDDPLVKMAFVGIAKRMSYDNDKYFATCDKNRDNIQKRWSEKKKKDAIPSNTTVYERIPTNTTVYEPIRTDTKNTDMDKDNDMDMGMDMEREWDKTRTRAREGSFPQGQYKNVRLTEEEHEALINELGEAVVNGTVERLSEYIQIHGDKYADHCAVVKKWAREDAANKDGASSDFDEDEYFEAALARSARYLKEHGKEAVSGDTGGENPP